jgi:hypothetical protein
MVTAFIVEVDAILIRGTPGTNLPIEKQNIGVGQMSVTVFDVFQVGFYPLLGDAFGIGVGVQPLNLSLHGLRRHVPDSPDRSAGGCFYTPSELDRPLGHDIRFSLQRPIIVDGYAILHRPCRLHSPLRLLDEMPCFVRKMLLLSRRDVDVGALRVSKGVQLHRPRGIVVDARAIQRNSGQGFNAGFEAVG